MPIQLSGYDLHCKLNFTSTHAEVRIAYKANLVGESWAEYIIFHEVNLTKKIKTGRGILWHEQSTGQPILKTECL